MPIQYSEQDDFDHFNTHDITIDDLNLDNLSVREALKRMMNLMLVKEKCYVGELALVSYLSIEKTEILIKHLITLNQIKKIESATVEMVELIKNGKMERTSTG